MLGGVAVKVEGNTIRGTGQRARADQQPGETCTVTNLGPAILEHSANQDGSTPTTIAAKASGTITGRRWLRSQGKSQVWVTGGVVDGVVV